MKFYTDGRKEGDFDHHRRRHRKRCSPARSSCSASRARRRRFRAPSQSYRLGDGELASRLSYFLWGAAPDAELSKLGAQGRLSAPGVYEKQVARLLADPRSNHSRNGLPASGCASATSTACCPTRWLIRKLDRTLGDAFIKESGCSSTAWCANRSILDLITADYTFVNEAHRQHYGIPNVTGNAFRRVTLPTERRGITTHGSVLVLTSVADRTSPVMRGKWVIVLMGSPPRPRRLACAALPTRKPKRPVGS